MGLSSQGRITRRFVGRVSKKLENWTRPVSVGVMGANVRSIVEDLRAYMNLAALAGAYECKLFDGILYKFVFSER